MHRPARCAGARAPRARCWRRRQSLPAWCWCAASTAACSPSARTTASAAGYTSARRPRSSCARRRASRCAGGLAFAGFPGGRLAAHRAGDRRAALGGERRAAERRDRARARRRRDRRPGGAGTRGLRRGVPQPASPATTPRPAGSSGRASSSALSGVSLDARYAFVADDRGAVHALDRSNGQSIWKQDKLAHRKLSTPLAGGETVAVGDFEGYVHFLARDSGAFLARGEASGGAVRADAAAPRRGAAGADRRRRPVCARAVKRGRPAACHRAGRTSASRPSLTASRAAATRSCTTCRA